MDELQQKCRTFATELCMLSLKKTRSDMIQTFEQTFDPDRRDRMKEGWLMEQGMLQKINELASEIEIAASRILAFEKPQAHYRVGS